jgi:hypothetical protein
MPAVLHAMWTLDLIAIIMLPAAIAYFVHLTRKDKT